MGNGKQKQLIVLAVMVLAVTALVYRSTPAGSVQKPDSLRAILGPVPGYDMVSSTKVDDDISIFLKLDDYTLTSYQGADRPISLYIGYYYSLEKLSAAHSPLVCFPGQGWRLQDHVGRTLQVGPNLINFAEMVASLDGRNELVLYWYQAGRTTATELYRNKLNAMWNRLTSGSEDHAFVRVTVPFREGDMAQARSAGIAFIAAFYPVFLNYVDQATEPVPAPRPKPAR